MSEICGDNRFEVIESAKKRFYESTNIKDSPAELAVLDRFLFRIWQMGWLPIECRNISLKSDQFICDTCKAHYDIARLDIDEDQDTGIPRYCPNCGARIVE